MKEAFKKAFPHTIQVLVGYLTLGSGFGILLSSIGYGPLWALLMSLTIFSGSSQYLCVELLALQVSLPSVALMTFIVNFRYMFYGLSMIDKFSGLNKIRPYLIFGLTDETYAIEANTRIPDGIKEKDFYLATTLLDHSYWLIGSLIGSTIGSIFTFNTEGIDFVMTALFVVLVVEQWMTADKHSPALIGFAITIICLIILGPDHFLIPSLLLICLILLLLEKKIGGQND